MGFKTVCKSFAEDMGVNLGAPVTLLIFDDQIFGTDSAMTPIRQTFPRPVVEDVAAARGSF